MPPETDPRRWLVKAETDLRSAQANLQPGFVLPAQSIWASQQATEKAIKAVLLSLNIRFPFTHDLNALAALLPVEHRPPVAVADLAELAQTATGLRYPSEDADPDLPAAERAHANATAVLGWARTVVLSQQAGSSDRS